MTDARRDTAGATIGVVVVSAGSGERARADGAPPKQYRLVDGKPVLRHSLELFRADPRIGRIVCVVNPSHAGLTATAIAGLDGIATVAGGDTRQASVLAGLEALADMAPDLVLVHDAARPFVTRDVVDRVVAALGGAAGALPVAPVTDTIKTVRDGVVTGTVDRATLGAAQTPQGFRFPVLLAAHRRAASAGDASATDDVALLERAGHAVRAVAGDPANIKLTTAADFARHGGNGAMRETRTATGFDVHAFEPGDHVTLGGVRIAHTARLSGHSDADVVLHALTDALLGTIGDGDIGSHFPPSEARWKGADSAVFLAFAAERVRAAAGRIVHLDVMILGEAPKIGPHRDAMRARIAAIAGIADGRVGVKATTMEGLGFVGRREGLAAIATATVTLPEGDGV